MYSRFIYSDSSAGSREEKVRRSSLYKYLGAVLAKKKELGYRHV